MIIGPFSQGHLIVQMFLLPRLQIRKEIIIITRMERSQKLRILIGLGSGDLTSA
jgi:hypothetical protein